MTPASIREQVLLPLRFADGFHTQGRVVTFDGLSDGREHLAVALADRAANPAGRPTGRAGVPLVRLHSECLTGDVRGSERCDCGPQLREAVERIDRTGGYLLYLRQEGRGIGLYNKLDAYALQEAGLDTYEANVALGFGPDERYYAAAAQMLLALGVVAVDLLTNNPDKRAQLESCGIEVVSQVPTDLHLSPANHRYLAAKAWQGHSLGRSADSVAVPPPRNGPVVL